MLGIGNWAVTAVLGGRGAGGKTDAFPRRPTRLPRATVLLLGILASPCLCTSSSVAQTFSNDDSTVSILVRFGMTDTEARSWDGSLQVAAGRLAQIRDWHSHPENRVGDDSSWSMATRKGANFGYRAWERLPGVGPKTYFWTPGVIVDLEGSAATRLDFVTANGNFSVRLGDVTAGHSVERLNGAVRIERVAPAERLSGPDHQDDFVSTLSGRNGDVWVCWVAYRNQASEVMVRRLEGSKWSPAKSVSAKPGDIFVAKMGRDAQNRPWVVWSEQVQGNWDLYGRFFEKGVWSSPERLTEAPQPDVFHTLATDSQGGMWLVWQGFRNGQSDIFAKRFDGKSWSSEEQLSTSPANDWEPVIATDSKDGVSVAWDTYDKGNYDVVMRRFTRQKWSEIAPIAETPRFEAHVSLAYDGQDRLWAAWNESGVNWGKDTGFILNTEGTALYSWRGLSVAVFDGRAWQVPATEINRGLPVELQDYNDFPLLQADAKGRVWLFFRHRTPRLRDVSSEAPAHRAAWEIWGTTLDGKQWMEPFHFPFSFDRMDARWGLALGSGGEMFAAWPTDNRDFDGFLFQHKDVYAARLPLPDRQMRTPVLIARLEEEVAGFPLHPTEDEDVKRMAAYKVESEGKTYGIFRGDVHRHTEFSMDGNNDGSLIETYRYAMDVARLDFLMASDHNGSAGPDVEYVNWLLQQMADVLSVPSKFVPFYGYERSVRYPNGHRNILFTERGIPTLPIPSSEQAGKTGAGELYKYLRENEGIAISHTSASNMGTDWRDNDPELEPLVEIYQGDRVSAEYEGAPRAANAENPNSAPGGFRPEGYVWNAWGKGYKLGVQSSSDHLSTHISYACTIAEEFTREGLIDAMKKRHSYGATDNIILDFRLKTAKQEFLQGDIVKVAKPFTLWINIIGTGPIRQVDIIKNQTFLHNRQRLGKEVNFSYLDNQVGPGENFYYVRVIQADGQMAWSSPIWVTVD